MRKRILSILLALSMVFSLCACGGGAQYGVKTVQTLVKQEYSLAFRNDDPTYFYVTAAIETLAAEGKVEELTAKWFGQQIIKFEKNGEALAALTPPEPRDFIIGIDINSFPMAYISSEGYWGFDIELASVVCAKLGWTLKLQPIEKEDVAIELSSGNIDCAWGGIALNPDEVEERMYTQYGPYVQNDIVVAARNGSSIWNKLRLSSKNMAMCSTPEAMEALNTDESLAKRLGQITRLAGGTTECFEYLYSGKCDTVLTDSTALYYFNCH
ncbi:MAG: transporter substrate-binding domain-containing protein [Candidatus Limivicinus sp.]|jgi:ABC-type amino acid transport substrate-binding protein